MVETADTMEDVGDLIMVAIAHGAGQAGEQIEADSVAAVDLVVVAVDLVEEEEVAVVVEVVEEVAK